MFFSIFDIMFEYKHLEEESKGDFAFEVYADTLEELFIGAGLATMSAMVKLESLRIEKEYVFTLESQDLVLLMYDFLSELIYIKDVETLLFKEFELKIEKKEHFLLHCTAKGALIDWEKNELYTDVKAATMHEMEIKQKENKWYFHAILDL